ncbi:cell surface hyaluronidase CEMIP2-like isoform X1 [Mytilus galloprovincialis]|uniref:cell surface hyaluronidase CEMIP2-like isoform X1 n=2 Tax=Mytilus galloprovincialis TaxID=29158 RepID=UPI003F7C2F3E
MWNSILLAIFCFSIFFESVDASSCPDDDISLKLWSDSSTWANAGLAIPTTTSDVKIKDGMNVKLDIDVDVNSITIETNGRLVWDSGKKTIVKTRYIYVKGTIEIGSEDCKFKAKTEIILKGTRNEVADKVGCGQKFICVAAGGTLELHGEDKLSWTKLDKTVNPLKIGDGMYYQHQGTATARNDWRKGLRVYAFDATSKSVIKESAFYLSGENSVYTFRDLERFGPFIDSIADGSIVAIALLRQLVGTSDLTDIYAKMESLGAKLIRTIDSDDAYAFIATKGDMNSAIEDINKSGYEQHSATVTMDFINLNLQIKVLSQVNTGSRAFHLSKVDFTMYNYDQANPVIDLVDNAQGWHKGDQIVFTSTDFDMEQAEYGSVDSCSNCGQKQIRASFTPEFVHWSKLENNVDMRGEVAILTRNIKIRGEMELACPTVNGNCKDYTHDTFGGHVKVLRHFKNVHIEGVELENMGQATSLGNYPLHFHMCHDTDDENYPNPPYLRKNSIHHSFARCITVHGSHGVTVMDNVCIEHLGHGIFLEDGGEKRTVIDGNLVALTRKGKLIHTDAKPSSFWITNPKTIIRNNVAAGSVDTGIWILYPNEPTGPSKGLGFMAYDEARHTKITEMDNNAIHSCRNGLFIDSRIIEENGELIADLTNVYYPQTMPTDPSNPLSEEDPVYIVKQTCWKNRFMNSWVRGGLIIMQQYSSADSSTGLTFAASTPSPQIIEKSVFMGETDNIGKRTEVWDNSIRRLLDYPRSLVMPWDPKYPIQGFVIYEGPVYLDSVWFDKFTPTENYTMGAISFKKHNKFTSSPVSAVSNLKFGYSDPSGGNRVYDGDETVHRFNNLDGDKMATIRDEDGSVTNLATIQQIVKPGLFYTTPSCIYRKNWNMAMCPYKYAKLNIKIDASSPEHGQTESIMVRDDQPDSPETLTGVFSNEFLTILGGTHSYTLHWSNGIPRKFAIYTKGVELNQYVRVGMCMPSDATFNLFTRTPLRRLKLVDWTEVQSIEELDSDTLGDRYFWDKSIGMLFLKFISYESRTDTTTSNCEGNCPYVQVDVLSGDRSNGDCRQAAYNNPGNYRKTSNGQMSTDTRTLAATDPTPPKGWGAGSQLPFTSRIPVNGGWSSWSAFKECSVTCGGGKQSQYRSCNKPATANGGTDCVGDGVNSVSCNEHPCPVNGKFSDWEQWSSCIVNSGCQGYRERERSCNTPAPQHGGIHCTGSVEEQEACNNCT